MFVRRQTGGCSNARCAPSNSLYRSQPSSVDLKDTIWSQLESWLNGLGAQFSEDEVEAFLKKCGAPSLSHSI